jgi:hypothetical protein
MQQPFEAFFEDINDALREAIRQLGGNKVVGSRLRPELPVTQAEGWLRDCLNEARREKLSPEQVLLLMVWANEAGYHGLMGYVATTSRYEAPRPVSAEQQEIDLQTLILEGIERQNKMLEQLQRVQRARVVRTAA